MVETYVRHEFTGYMIGFSWIVGETMDLSGDMMSRTSIFGRQIGPFHTRSVVNGPVMDSSMVTPSEFSGQHLTSAAKIFQIDDNGHFIERVSGRRRRRGSSSDRVCPVRSRSYRHLGRDRGRRRRHIGIHDNFCPVPTFSKPDKDNWFLSYRQPLHK